MPDQRKLTLGATRRFVVINDFHNGSHFVAGYGELLDGEQCPAPIMWHAWEAFLRQQAEAKYAKNGPGLPRQPCTHAGHPGDCGAGPANGELT